jgi:hypothetical protein
MERLEPAVLKDLASSLESHSSMPSIPVEFSRLKDMPRLTYRPIMRSPSVLDQINEEERETDTVVYPLQTFVIDSKSGTMFEERNPSADDLTLSPSP